MSHEIKSGHTYTIAANKRFAKDGAGKEVKVTSVIRIGRGYTVHYIDAEGNHLHLSLAKFSALVIS